MQECLSRHSLSDEDAVEASSVAHLEQPVPEEQPEDVDSEWTDYWLEHLSMTPAELVAQYEEYLREHDDGDSVQQHCIESAAQPVDVEKDASLYDQHEDNEDEEHQHEDEDEDHQPEDEDSKTDEDDDVCKIEDSTCAPVPVPLGSFYTCVPEYGSRLVRRSYRLRRSPVPSS